MQVVPFPTKDNDQMLVGVGAIFVHREMAFSTVFYVSACYGAMIVI